MITEFLTDLNPDVFSYNEDFYRDIILAFPDWKEIPFIHSAVERNYPDGTLVRFKGMVQDMRGPEFYFEQLQVYNPQTGKMHVRHGRYRDSCPIMENEKVVQADIRSSGQRYPLVVISMPGLSDWAKKEEEAICDRALDGYDLARALSQDTPDNTALKKYFEEVDFCDEEMLKLLNLTSTSEKKNQAEKNNVVLDELEMTVEQLLNHPVPDITNHTCIFKLYEDMKHIQLNDMVEAVGFLSVDPALDGRQQFKDLLDWESRRETLAHNPPPRLIPRLHVVCIRRMVHCNPLLEHNIDPDQPLLGGASFYAFMLGMLSDLLLGDKLAAQYLLCHLISHVYVRRDTHFIGPLNLNITNVPVDKIPDYVPRLYYVLKQLVTKSFYLPLTVDNLNSSDFLPRKDLVCDRLESALLQLSVDTHLVVDETALRPGRLQDSGFRNVAALVSLLRAQKVNYNYKYFDMEVDTDIPICVFSQGTSILKCECVVPLRPVAARVSSFEATYRAACSALRSPAARALRMHISALKLLNFTMPNDTSFVAEGFASLRAGAPPQRPVTEDDLHRLLVVARLHALARARPRLHPRAWGGALRMETRRLQRLAGLPDHPAAPATTAPTALSAPTDTNNDAA